MPTFNRRNNDEGISHPGEILARELQEREISQKEFAEEISMAYSQFNEILKGKRSISADVAILLDAALGIPAIFWTNLQAKYDLDIAMEKTKNQEKADIIRWQREIKPYIAFNFFKEKGIITGHREKDEQTIKNVFRINNIEEISQQITDFSNSKFKKSEVFVTDPVNLNSWLKYVTYLSLREDVSRFNPTKEKDLLSELRSIFSKDDVVKATKGTLSNYGISFQYENKPEKVPVDGVAFSNDKNPVVALTGRYKRIDNFAFTLFHEIAHVILHLENGSSNKLFIDNLENKQLQNDTIEAQANEFAQDNLIPKDKWLDFISAYTFDDDYIIEFAEACSIHPAIVRGRLCNENLISYKSKTAIDYSIN